MPIRDDERVNAGHSAVRRREPIAIEPEAASEASLVPGATGARETGPKTHFRGFALTWLGPLGLVLLAAASSVLVDTNL